MKTKLNLKKYRVDGNIDPPKNTIPEVTKKSNIKYVDNVNDPIYKAYQDSLNLYNKSVNDIINKNIPITNTVPTDPNHKQIIKTSPDYKYPGNMYFQNTDTWRNNVSGKEYPADQWEKEHPNAILQAGYRTRKYGDGGWLQVDRNDSMAKKIFTPSLQDSKKGAEIGSVAGPYGALIGGIAGGIYGNLENIFGFGNKDQNENAEPYQAPVAKAKQIYAQGKMGLNMNDLTSYNGPSHEQGGIPLGDTGAEVEGGEVRTGDMIHSDTIKVDKNLLKQYSDILKKKDMGKTIAKVVKNRNKPFEKRKGDEFNDKAQAITMMPFNEMSDELSQMYQMKNKSAKMPSKMSPMNTQMKGGGKISPIMMNILNKRGIHRGKMMNESNMYASSGSLFDFVSKKGSSVDGGNASLYINAAGMLGNMLTPVEKVNYKQQKYAPTQVTPISTQAGINAIGNTYGNTKADLKRLNPQSYVANMNRLAAQEASTKGQYAQQVGIGNAEQANQASIYDSQNRMRVGSENQQVAIAEAEANAQNRGIKKTTTQAYLNNMGTMLGQQARDKKLMDMQEKNQNTYFDLLQQQINLQKDKEKPIVSPISKSSPFNYNNSGMGWDVGNETFNEPAIPVLNNTSVIGLGMDASGSEYDPKTGYWTVPTKKKMGGSLNKLRSKKLKKY